MNEDLKGFLLLCGICVILVGILWSGGMALINHTENEDKKSEEFDKAMKQIKEDAEVNSHRNITKAVEIAEEEYRDGNITYEEYKGRMKVLRKGA